MFHPLRFTNNNKIVPEGCIHYRKIGGNRMMNDGKIKKIASILFEYSLSEDEQYVLDGLSLISNRLEGELNENIDVDGLNNMRILCREMSNYLTHVSNEDNEHLQRIQLYLLLIALRKLIGNRKDDQYASTQY